MMQIIYFGRLREQLQSSGEKLEYSAKSGSVRGLLEQLCQRGEPWASALDGRATVLVAVNQEMAGAETALADGDEVAFFPPVTGG